MNKTQVAFSTVNTPAEKLNRLYEIIQRQFSLGKRILIAVPNPEAATFIDQLLWKHNVTSFIPHVVSNSATQEFVVITTESVNLNKASVLVNLCAGISPIAAEFQYIYELQDNTHPQKAELSLKRQSDYEAAGFSIHV